MGGAEGRGRRQCSVRSPSLARDLEVAAGGLGGRTGAGVEEGWPGKFHTIESNLDWSFRNMDKTAFRP